MKKMTALFLALLIAAGASGKVAANENGRALLVVDSTTTEAGIIL